MSISQPLKAGLLRHKRWNPRQAMLRSMILALSSMSVYAQTAGPRQVAIVPAMTATVPNTIKLVGTIDPYARSLLASEVAGLVEKMKADHGDRLESGAPICHLRNTTHRLALEQAQAALQQLESRLEELENGTRQELKDQAKANMEEAKALFENWDRELQRVTGLFKQNQASPKEYNDTIAEHAAAKQRLAATTAALDLAVAGPRKEEIAQARFAVSAQKALVERLQYDLEQTVIRSPFAGYITAKHTEVGQWINIGGSVVELIDLERLRIRVDVPESAISAVHPGDAVSVDIQALDKTCTGRIKNIIPQADVRARTFPVEIELPNPDHDLKSGMFVRARLSVGSPAPSIIVPRDAVIQRAGIHYVVTVTPPPPPAEGMLAAPVPVMLGAELGHWVAIEGTNVQADVLVAVKGHDRIFGPTPVVSISADWIQPPPTTGPPTSAPAAASTTKTLSVTGG